MVERPSANAVARPLPREKRVRRFDKGERASTEGLRIALQRYPALFERLLSL